MTLQEFTALIAALKGRARATLSPRRYRHTRGVARTGAAIARRAGLDTVRVLVAAYAHDMAREWGGERLLAFCSARTAMDDFWRTHESTIASEATALEMRHPLLLHGRAAALLLYHDYNCRDMEVLRGVRCHTLGDPNIGAVGGALMCADYLEPHRTHIERAVARRILKLSLPDMTLAVLDHARHINYDVAEITQKMYTTIRERRYL